MENNEFDKNNVENQTNENVKKELAITIVLLIIVLVLVLGIGIGAGLLFSRRGNNNKPENNTNSSVSNNTSANNTVNNANTANTANTINTTNTTNTSNNSNEPNDDSKGISILPYKNDIKNETGKKVKSESPSGWAGSSMHEIRLYSNGNVYHVVYSGDGNIDENIVHSELIAQGANDIEYKANEHGDHGFEAIIVKGNNLKILDDSYLWINYETTTTSAQNTSTANSEYNTAINAMKKCLKDESWLKENVYIKQEEGGVVNGADLSDQKIDFIVCRGDKIPIVILEVESENARFHKIILVAYVNGNVKSEIISQGHIYHGGYTVDANKNVVNSGYMHMGDNTTILYQIVDGKIKIIGGYTYVEYFQVEEESTGKGEYKDRYFLYNGTAEGPDKEVNEEEYINYKKSLNESQYNFVSIGTEFNNQNVDAYVK